MAARPGAHSTTLPTSEKSKGTTMNQPQRSIFPASKFLAVVLSVIALSVIALASYAGGQQASSTQASAQQASAQQAADALFSESKWQEASQAYSQILAGDATNGQAWQNLGESYVQLGRLPEALQAFTKATDNKFRPLMNKINVARVYTAMGNTRSALDALKEVAASGQAPRLRGFIAGTSEFQKLWGNAEYQQFLKSIAPCQTPEYRQFDFWIGEWEVHSPDGPKVGDNSVTREQDGCLLVEHWKGGRGIETGTSFNYYDVRDKMWHQLYIDNSGNAGAFPAMSGSLVDGKIVLISDEKASPVFRWTWYVLSPGKVRQMAEQSNDGQKSWQTVWDSTYVAKSEHK